MEKERIKISVRNLVEFILRSGNLDNRRTSAADREAMQKGSRIHRKLQKQMKPSYKAEVPLKWEEEYPDFIIEIEGRADGIIDDDGECVIDEIKGVYRDLYFLEEPVPVHKAQAMCYAYFYASQKKISKIEVQMTYCHLETEEIKRFREEFSFSYLKKWFEDLLSEYYKWANFQYQRRIERRSSMEGLEFPYPYRKGQKELVSGVYHTMRTEKQLFIQAPTGIGKTMAAIFPAVRAVGEGYGDKIFYLTAKTITRTVAEEAFHILKEKGLSYKTISITAKEKLCLCEETDCNPEKCPYAEGHFDRVNVAVFEILNAKDTYLREDLLDQAEKHRVCPYEMCLDISSWVDAVICDYNYVFDPNVYLRRFFGDSVKGEYLFLIDEAHNLVERGRKMYSAVLCKEDFLETAKIVKEHSAKLYKILKKCNRLMLEYKRECDEYTVMENIAGLSLQLMNLLGEMENFLEKDHEERVQKAVLEFSFSVRHFLNMYDLADENYVIYSHYDEEQRFLVTLYCVNPKRNLQECLNKGKGTVFFSGTFLPLPYYRSLFSERRDDYAICASSPFLRENLKLLVACDVSSKYTRRSVSEYEKMAEYIYAMAAGKQGNYMVFFPSYRMLEDIYEIFRAKAEERQFKVSCILQSSNMTEKEREEFLEAFQENTTGTLIGFCVMGGIFSEGIDLTGERLIGAAIVGTGLPQVGCEREILKNYYDEKAQNGFAYAYRYPGMNKVLQAAGRVIRTKEDRGVVLLLDERFLQREYLELFPQEWQGYEKCTIKNAGQKIKAFWDN
ncbi:ATP-dependent DNA helicase [Blautia sp. Marseille-P3201T]|uniref:ATP-dependent DNA helicase n=1 Tax=Blautia sp. Marseille-P3201T TaxID=1907659 RepID=UPI00093197A8|nr:ATP-dependent DNA helicase [Blautia sp. Marseille-P3201T]